MEDKQMGFYVMLASMLLGLLALKIGFSQFKVKKDKCLIYINKLSWHSPCSRGCLVRMAKITRETSVKPRFSDEFLGCG